MRAAFEVRKHIATPIVTKVPSVIRHGKARTSAGSEAPAGSSVVKPTSVCRSPLLKKTTAAKPAIIASTLPRSLPRDCVSTPTRKIPSSERVFQSLPKAEGGGGKTLSLTASRIREAAFDKFVEMLVGDRSVYAEKLDYYEDRFNQAMAAMRADAQREILPDANRSVLLEVDLETGVLSGNVERADESFDPFKPPSGMASRFAVETVYRGKGVIVTATGETAWQMLV